MISTSSITCLSKTGLFGSNSSNALYVISVLFKSSESFNPTVVSVVPCLLKNSFVFSFGLTFVVFNLSISYLDSSILS